MATYRVGRLLYSTRMRPGRSQVEGAGEGGAVRVELDEVRPQRVERAQIGQDLLDQDPLPGVQAIGLRGGRREPAANHAASAIRRNESFFIATVVPNGFGGIGAATGKTGLP